MGLRRIATQPAALSLGLVAAVFAVDLCLPLGVASAVPYTFAVLLALTARPWWFGLAVAVLCGILTLAKMEAFPERGTTELWKVIANRYLALFAIGMTTLLGVLRRRAEERAREHQAALAHVGRLSLLGQVTAGLAHELNQPLAAVCLQADIASRLAVQGQPVRPELSVALVEIAEQSARAAGIVKGLRRLAGRAHPGNDPVDLNAAVRVVARLLDWKARRAGAVMELHLSAPSGTVRGDPILIEQVLFNLIQNAIEAVATRLDGPRVVTIDITPGPETLVVSVRDTGPGLSDPEKVFEPFYTTKPDGMGLGLAISGSIVEAHGGRLCATSLDDGTEFSFTLPLARPEES